MTVSIGKEEAADIGGQADPLASSSSQGHRLAPGGDAGANPVAPQPIDIRPANNTDVAWIYSTWLKNYREFGSCSGHYFGKESCVGRIPGFVYWKDYRAAVQRVTSRPGVATLVACPSDNDEQILGWLCGERIKDPVANLDKAIFHYGQVKSERRQQGIMRALVEAFDLTPETQCSYTHHTKLFWRNEHNEPHSCALRSILPQSWIFNPYLFA